MSRYGMLLMMLLILQFRYFVAVECINVNYESGSIRSCKDFHYEEKISRNPLWVGLGAVAGAVGAVVAIPVVLTAVGFTSAGIAGGSLAASIMSASGPIAVGSGFATLQSIGAAGMGAASMGAAAAAGAAVGGGATAALSKKEK